MVEHWKHLCLFTISFCHTFFFFLRVYFLQILHHGTKTWHISVQVFTSRSKYHNMEQFLIANIISWISITNTDYTSHSIANFPGSSLTSKINQQKIISQKAIIIISYHPKNHLTSSKSRFSQNKQIGGTQRYTQTHYNMDTDTELPAHIIMWFAKRSYLHF